MEKGYRYFGTDLTMLDTPDEAGLGAVRPTGARAVHRPGRGRSTAGEATPGWPGRADCGRSSSATTRLPADLRR